MNGTERIEAAIVKLEGLRGNATYGPWFVGGEGEFLYNSGPAHCDIEAAEFAFAELNNMDDGELIVTLHRTIDAQLATLRFALDQANKSGFEYFDHDHEMLLADAILGGVS